MKSCIDSVHEWKKPFKCNIWDATFSEKSKLNNDLSKKSFKCSICDGGKTMHEKPYWFSSWTWKAFQSAAFLIVLSLQKRTNWKTMSQGFMKEKNSFECNTFTASFTAKQEMKPTLIQFMKEKNLSNATFVITP